MNLKIIGLAILLSALCVRIQAQQTTLTTAQQTEDFAIFTGGLQEGHSGLYYFIDPKTFAARCDSIRNTFVENAPVEDYYLKLRYLITLLCHGHTRINLPTNGWINYKMGVLDSTKLYLPFVFLIVNQQLLIKEDCSKEQLFPKYAAVKSIDDISVKKLMDRMLPFIPADGINQSFKYYNLYNYFYFHYLYNLFYSNKKAFKLELENDHTHYYIQALKAGTIDSIYKAKNNRSISTYGRQLAYVPDMGKNTGYLQIGSFYKGLIENAGQQYVPFLDSAFTDIQTRHTRNLILDLRDNEGGGDGYDNILLAYLIGRSPVPQTAIRVPGRRFQYTRYAVNLSEDVKGFIDNPSAFLRDDSTLLLKDELVEMMKEGIINPPANAFTGNIIVLTNGGSFSASTAVIAQLYTLRKTTGRQVLFVGEENGGDIYCGTECAGQSYTIKLPNSAIAMDMPFLCFGTLTKDYPKKRLPDLRVHSKTSDLQKNKDTVLEFAIHLCRKK